MTKFRKFNLLENYIVNTNVEQYRPLYNAVCSGDLDAVNKFLLDQPEAITAPIVSGGDRPLHMAIMFRHYHIVEKLLQLMSADDLLVTDAYGNTHLHVAVADIKNNEISKQLTKMNSKMLTMVNANGWIPLTFAIEYGNTDMVRYLYCITPFDLLKPESGNHGVILLRRCYYSKMLGKNY